MRAEQLLRPSSAGPQGMKPKISQRSQASQFRDLKETAQRDRISDWLSLFYSQNICIARSLALQRIKAGSENKPYVCGYLKDAKKYTIDRTRGSKSRILCQAEDRLESWKLSPLVCWSLPNLVSQRKCSFIEEAHQNRMISTVAMFLQPSEECLKIRVGKLIAQVYET